MSKLSDLINQSLKGDSAIYAEVSFGNIPNAIAQKIAAETGVTCQGSEIIITAYDVAHIFKGHGNDVEEKKRGQIGVVAQDLENIRDIILNYDSVTKGKDSRRAQSLIFVKSLKSKCYLIVSVEGRIPSRKMVVKTMYKKP